MTREQAARWLAVHGPHDHTMDDDWERAYLALTAWQQPPGTTLMPNADHLALLVAAGDAERELAAAKMTVEVDRGGLVAAFMEVENATIVMDRHGAPSWRVTYQTACDLADAAIAFLSTAPTQEAELRARLAAIRSGGKP